MAVHERLLALPAFQRELRAITIRSVAAQFPMLTLSSAVKDATFDINYALTCASVLAQSERGDCQDAALRIAHFALLTLPPDAAAPRAAAAVVLDTLTNRPALALAIRRQYVEADVLASIPAPLRLDALRREATYSLVDGPDQPLTTINRFQLSLYRAAESKRWVSASAPTSSGKSFILERTVRDALLSGTARRIVYLVPTRALVQEVELDFRHSLGALPVAPVVTSIPHVVTDTGQAVVLIFTQERLNLLLTEDPDFVPDLIVVDEAQKIGEGARGILLEDVLAESSRRNPDARIIFASPMTSNPEALLASARTDDALTVVSQQVAVNQNLLWASQLKREPTEWKLELCLSDDLVELGTFSLPFKPTPESKRLPMVAAALEPELGALIYVKGAAEAENTAILLADYFGRQPSESSEIADLVALVERTIHKDYALVGTLPSGVAFHYGNMPLLVRTEIERLFRLGVLRCLVCTSTLVEGVNLPARSIFVRGPQKGIGKPMSSIDFWNLAGRAGRQGKEFQGNVVCVDPRAPVWKAPPPRERSLYTIQKSSDRILDERGEEFISYILEGTPVSTTQSFQELESAFSFFLHERGRFGSLSQSPRATAASPQLLKQLDTALEETMARLELPDAMRFRNAGVSPLSQQRLLEFFRTRKDIESVVPADPGSDDAVESYTRVVGLTSTYLSGDPQQLNFSRAILVVHWMRGYPLARLIAEAWRYWSTRNRRLAQVIRDTMRDVEEYARFRFAKYSSCYIDVLRFHLEEIGRSELAARIPRLNVWLEFGTAIQTQLSLIGLGLSRTSAIELSQLIADDNLDVPGVRLKLEGLNLTGATVSPVIVREVGRVLGRAGKAS